MIGLQLFKNRIMKHVYRIQNYSVYYFNREIPARENSTREKSYPRIILFYPSNRSKVIVNRGGIVASSNTSYIVQSFELLFTTLFGYRVPLNPKIHDSCMRHRIGIPLSIYYGYINYYYYYYQCIPIARRLILSLAM